MLNRIVNSCKSRVRIALQSVAVKLIKILRLDSQKIYFEVNGVLKYKGYESGEKWFIHRVLPRILFDIDEPVILDIGANVGNYSLALASALPACRCYAFEPNPTTFERLVSNTRAKQNIIPLNYGAGNKRENIELFVYKTDSSTSHASVYSDVFKECHMQNDNSIDSLFCALEKVDSLIDSGIVPESFVHFIKIDTEGHELEGLRGAIESIKTRGVRAVQFEFNEMNVISRVFLKDFYDLLGDDWVFFRLDTKKLLYLGPRYDTSNEIFKFHNIVVVHKPFVPLLFDSRLSTLS